MYFSDWLGDTMHLTTLQHGAYFLSGASYWITRKPLIGNDDYLAAITKTTMEEWLAMKPIIQDFFEVDNNLWFHARIEEELAKAQSKYDIAVANGRKGGIAKSEALANAKASATHSLKQKSSKKLPNHNHNHNHKEIDILHHFAFCQEFFEKHHLPIPGKITPKRKKRFNEILKTVSADKFREVIQKIAESPFLLGNNKRKFKANIDFILREDIFVKLSEGNYSVKSNDNPSEESVWDTRLTLWKKGTWINRPDSNNDWGPPPDHKNTWVPLVYLKKHGVVSNG